MMCVRPLLANMELKRKMKEEMEKWEKCSTNNDNDSNNG